VQRHSDGWSSAARLVEVGDRVTPGMTLPSDDADQGLALAQAQAELMGQERTGTFGSWHRREIIAQRRAELRSASAGKGKQRIT